MRARRRLHSRAPRCRPTVDSHLRTRISWRLPYSNCVRATVRSIRDDLIRLIRADEGGEYKLVPILSALYSTVLRLHLAVSALWGSGVSRLLAIVPAAIY